MTDELPPYRLIRSNRRTVSMEIDRDRAELIIRAPRQMPIDLIQAFIAAHREWAVRGLERKQQELADRPILDEQMVDRLKKQAHLLLPRRVAYYAALMGVSPRQIRITSARTRFGSCSSEGTICFSWRLMLYPAEAIDYVVVHELAHLIHMNHSEAFYREVAAVLPDWQRRAALLKH